MGSIEKNRKQLVENIEKRDNGAGFGGVVCASCGAIVLRHGKYDSKITDCGRYQKRARFEPDVFDIYI